MKNKIKFFLLLILMMFIGYRCTTQPSELAGADEKGAIFISLKNSNAEAQIYINNRPTKYYTPDKLNLSPGKYNVKVQLPGYNIQPDSIDVNLDQNQLEEVNFEVTPVTTGELKINSSLDDINIWIDGLLYDMDSHTINKIETGPHTVKIEKTGYHAQYFQIDINKNSTTKIEADLKKKSQIFLIEHFSNVNCQPCAERDKVLRNYISNHDSTEIISIGYHTSFPSDRDPFYLSAKPNNDGRVSYYDVISTPSYFIEGASVSAFSSNEFKDNLKEYFSQDFSDNPNLENFHIELEEYVDKIQGYIKFKSNSIDTNKLKLRIALINKNIIMSTPPGTNGKKEFHNILLEMYPDHSGQTLELNQNASRSYTFTFEDQPALQNNLQVIAFIQDDNTKEIIASTESIIF